MASIALVSLSIFIFPHSSLGGHVYRTDALEFSIDERHQASLLYISRDPDSFYTPSKKTIQIVVTSYNSEPGQTDSTPFITAFGTQVRDGIVATNYLPKGTKVRFPDLYGSKVFVVEDRMNIRYHKRMDIWSADKEFSRQFGARYLRMEIL
jgi:3D (Asp-Asp-Asp) domain-containing protein